jgi:hypothetical protein
MPRKSRAERDQNADHFARTGDILDSIIPDCLKTTDARQRFREVVRAHPHLKAGTHYGAVANYILATERAEQLRMKGPSARLNEVERSKETLARFLRLRSVDY